METRPALIITLALVAFVVPALAGCSTPEAVEPVVRPSEFAVVDAAGAPVPFAQVSAFTQPMSGDTGPSIATPAIRIFNADAGGRFLANQLPAEANYVVASAAGKGSASATLDGPGVLQLSPTVAAIAALGFEPHVELLCTTPDQAPAADCGQFGEPVVEVAGDGTIWASATCCVYKAPPIWVSRDGGKTFPQMRNADTGLVRDAYGIEGDFAIDDAGNVYFFDIAVATIWFTSYDAAGNHRWTLPWIAEPAVDRPWVRAGVEDQVWIFYNALSETRVYASTDGGMTWSVQPTAVFPCGLGNPGQGPTRNDLYVAAACGGGLTVWSSHDGGATWDDGEEVPMPDVKYNKNAGRGLELMNPPVADEAGNVYLPFTHYLDGKNQQNAIFMARRAPDGAWAVPVQVSAAGLNHLPWPAAGRGGHVGLAWYFAEGTFDKESSADWHLMAAASVDAGAVEPHYQMALADTTVLLHGFFGRMLGDFIEADLTPDGRMVVVYAMNDGTDLTNLFVQTDGLLDLAPERFLNGPHPA